MIRRLYIENYKCFEKNEMLFDDRIAFLSGKNGTGKTAFFEILELLRDLIHRGIPLMSEVQPAGIRVLGRTFTRWLQLPEGAVRTQRFGLTVDCGDEQPYEYCLAVDSRGPGGYARIVREEVACGGRPVYLYENGTVHLFDSESFEEKVAFGADSGRSFIASVADRPENRRLVRFRTCIGNIRVLQPNPWSIGGIAAGESAQLSRDFSNFADWFRCIKQETSERDYSEFLNELRSAMPGFQELRLRDAGDHAKEIVAEFSGIGGQSGMTSYLLRELSEGQRLLIAMYAAIYYAPMQGGVFCLDEPDNFLSLTEIAPLIDLLKERIYESRAGQLFISSHHPKFYDSFGKDRGFCFVREDDDGMTPTRLKPFSQLFGGLDRLSPSEVIARGWEE